MIEYLWKTNWMGNSHEILGLKYGEFVFKKPSSRIKISSHSNSIDEQKLKLFKNLYYNDEPISCLSH